MILLKTFPSVEIKIWVILPKVRWKYKYPTQKNVALEYPFLGQSSKWALLFQDSSIWYETQQNVGKNRHGIVYSRGVLAGFGPIWSQSNQFGRK